MSLPSKVPIEVIPPPATVWAVVISNTVFLLLLTIGFVLINFYPTPTAGEWLSGQTYIGAHCLAAALLAGAWVLACDLFYFIQGRPLALKRTFLILSILSVLGYYAFFYFHR